MSRIAHAHAAGRVRVRDDRRMTGLQRAEDRVSERNGDRARFQKNRKRKLRHRQRIRALFPRAKIQREAVELSIEPAASQQDFSEAATRSSG